MKTIKFLGTAGARFVMLKQLRASGGMWLSWKDTNLIIDPGPGSLVRCLRSRPRLNPLDLDGIILTHRHLDHSADINVMIEAMTEGGHRPKGRVFAPADALEDDPVILKYNRNFVDKIEILKQNKTYKVKDVTFSTAGLHVHGCQTFGLNFKEGKKTPLSLISDTRYFKGLARKYPGEVLIINVVRYEGRGDIEHLDISDVIRVLDKSKARVCILSHFGMTMLKKKPHLVAEDLQARYKDKKIIAAYDGMNFDLQKHRIKKLNKNKK